MVEEYALANLTLQLGPHSNQDLHFGRI